MYVRDLDTPCVVIDIDRVERNINEFQAYCDAHGFQSRPHIKTHKMHQIAQMQIQAGAVGITCQKIGEAEEMALAGIQDILIYYNIIGRSKLSRLTRLAQTIQISVAVDSIEVLKCLGETAQQEGCTIGVLVDCDTGYHRTGVQTPEEALSLALTIMEYPNLRFLGLGTYPFTEQSAAWFQSGRQHFEEAKIKIPRISGGSSASPSVAHKVDRITEIRAGTYVFYDWSSVMTGVASVDQCAARVVTTIVNRPTEHIGILDAGSKTLSSDSGYMKPGNGFGHIVEYPEAKIFALSEEHGHVDFGDCVEKPQIGEQVTVIPNHICGTINMHDEVLVYRNEKFEAVWKVAARGKIR